MQYLKLYGQQSRLTIPQPMREKLGWQAGDLLAFREKGGAVIITREYAQAPVGKAAAAKDNDPLRRAWEKCVTGTFRNPLAQFFLLLMGGDGNA